MSGACDIPGVSTACQLVGTVAASQFDGLATAAGNAAAWMFTQVWNVVDSTTLIDIGSDNYLKVYNVLFGIAIFLMLIFFFLQLITGLLRRDPAALQRAALGLARAVLGSFLAIALTGVLLQIVDQLCISIVEATGTTVHQMGGKIAALATGFTTISITTPGVGALLTIVLSFLAIAGAATVWFSLLIRKALLLVGIAFAPIALSGAVWDATKGWASKWAAFAVALIISKLVMVVVFLVAINQLNAPISSDTASLTDPIAGIVLMFVAAFAPYMAYKFVSFIGFDLHHAVTAEQETKQAMARPIPFPGTPSGNAAQKVLRGIGGSDSGASGAGASGAGASGSAARGAAAGASAAGGPAAAAVLGGKAVSAVATAGPTAASAVGGAANQHLDASHPPAPSSAAPAPSGSPLRGNAPSSSPPKD
jgi:type IV secretion system protein TrbL